MSDHRDAIYRKVEVMVRPILESNARSFARQLGMTHAEALQEARFGLVLALRKYDYNDSKGGIFNFVKTAVHRHFLKVWAVHNTQARRPHVQVTTETGKRISLPVAMIYGADEHRPFARGKESVSVDPGFGKNRNSSNDFMDSFESRLSLPDSALMTTDAESIAGAFQNALVGVLSERDRQVLECKYVPPRGLQMLMLDELVEEPTIPLIARYLGLSKNEVDWALRRIREAALSLIGRDFSELAESSIVRAYVERRP